jgi:hypothetical protein
MRFIYFSNEDSSNNEIYPAPESFRVFDENMSENDASDTDIKKTTTSKKEKEKQVDYLNELNKDLQEELKQTFTPRGTLAGQLIFYILKCIINI